MLEDGDLVSTFEVEYDYEVSLEGVSRYEGDLLSFEVVWEETCLVRSLSRFWVVYAHRFYIWKQREFQVILESEEKKAELDLARQEDKNPDKDRRRIDAFFSV